MVRRLKSINLEGGVHGPSAYISAWTLTIIIFKQNLVGDVNKFINYPRNFGRGEGVQSYFIPYSGLSCLADI